MNDITRRRIEEAMAALFPHGAGRAPHMQVRSQLERVAQVAYREGQNGVLMSLLTIQDVAERFGLTPRRVRALARNRHERYGVGWQVPGTNQWLFRPEEVCALAPDERYRRTD